MTKQTTWYLETTSTSITRLKRCPGCGCTPFFTGLKRQVPRLRDWNQKITFFLDAPHLSWNDKYLDYEIETRIVPYSLICLLFPMSTWNDKYLDYEIETCHRWIDRSERCLKHGLETTSTSITRLKPQQLDNVYRATYNLETTSTSITRLKLR